MKIINIKKFQIIILLGITAFSLIACGQNNQIKNIINKDWKPLSKVYLNFGTMIITSNTIEWNKGNKTKFKIKSCDEDGCFINLIDGAEIHSDIYYKAHFKYYIDKQFEEEQLEVTFLEDGRTSTWGVYFRD